MEITSIIIRRLSMESKMRAVVSITFDNAFVVHDVKVIEGARGLFIAMPSRKTAEGEFKDIVHPINSTFRDELSAAVLDKYQQAVKEQASGLSHPIHGEEDSLVEPGLLQEYGLSMHQGYEIETP